MLPSEEAAAYRACTDPAARQRARERIATAVRLQALRGLRQTLRGRGAPIPDDLEDRVQPLAVKLTAMIVDGQIHRGDEDAYVARAARNAAIDVLRGRGDPRRAEIPHDAAAVATMAEVDPFARAMQAAESQGRLDAIDEALAHAPVAYREVIEHLHLRGASIDLLVERELATRGEAPTDPAAHKRAENVVHQRASRARAWLRKALLDAGEGHDGG